MLKSEVLCRAFGNFYDQALGSWDAFDPKQEETWPYLIAVTKNKSRER
jgi:hypothetical protein